MNYRMLSKHEWQGHALNRFQGGMVGVLAWTSLQLAFGVLLIAGLASEGTGFLFLDGVPDWYEWALWAAMIGGPFVIVPALFLRARAAPRLFAGYIALTFLLLLGAEGYQLNWFAAARYAEDGGWIGAAIFAAAVTVDLIVIAYLFRSPRANVIFHRREHA